MVFREDNRKLIPIMFSIRKVIVPAAVAKKIRNLLSGSVSSFFLFKSCMHRAHKNLFPSSFSHHIGTEETAAGPKTKLWKDSTRFDCVPSLIRSILNTDIVILFVSLFAKRENNKHDLFICSHEKLEQRQKQQQQQHSFIVLLLHNQEHDTGQKKIVNNAEK
jgi:hypothetical protein